MMPGRRPSPRRIGDVVRLHDLGDLVEALVEEALLVVREAPFRHDAAAAADDAGDALGRHRDVAEPHAGMDGEIVDALLGLLDQRVAEDLPGQVLGDAADLFQRLVDRDGADRHGRVAQDPFAGVVDVAAGGEVHHRVRAPADRPDHLVDFGGDVRGDGGIADIGVDLDEEVAADRHRLGFGVVDVVGDDRAAAGDLVADEFGGDVIGDRGAVGFAVADIFGEAGAAEILADGDIFHLGGDDAAAGIVHLADVGAGLGAERALDDVGEGRDAAAAIGAELAVILGADFARLDLLDIAAAEDPVAAERGEAGLDVDAGVRIGVGARGVVDADRRLARRGLEMDLAHRHAKRADMDFLRAADRAGGDADFGAGGDVGHSSSPNRGEDGPG
jgi:hypothetical protein